MEEYWNTKCEACAGDYAGFDGAKDKHPVLFPCLCKVCRGCALKEEQTPAAGTHAHCPNCKRKCNLPVSDLLVDVALMHHLSSDSSATKDVVSACELCEEASATKYCHSCSVHHRMLCESCHAFAHRSGTKQGHASIPIEEHHASAPKPASAAERAATEQLFCRKHGGEQHALDSYCDTCQELFCNGPCRYDHSGCTFKALANVTGEHEQQIKTAIEATTASKVAVHDAIAVLNALDRTVGENELIAVKAVDAIFNPLEQAVRKRKEAVKAVIKHGSDRKKAAISIQVSALEFNETNAEHAVALSNATLGIGSTARLLEYKHLLLGGLRLHQLPPSDLAPPCGPGFEIIDGRGAELKTMLTLIESASVALSGDTDPARCTVLGDAFALGGTSLPCMPVHG